MTRARVAAAAIAVAALGASTRPAAAGDAATAYQVHDAAELETVTLRLFETTVTW